MMNVVCWEFNSGLGFVLGLFNADLCVGQKRDLQMSESFMT